MNGGLPRLPAIPLTAAEALPTTLDSFLTSFASARAAHARPVNVIRDVLPHCAVGAPLSRRSVVALSNRCMSFRKLLGEMATAEGRDGVLAVVDPREVERLVSFWSHEFRLCDSKSDISISVSFRQLLANMVFIQRRLSTKPISSPLTESAI